MTLNAVENGLKNVDDALLEIVVTDVELLQQASQHIIGSGGKRLRPQIVFLAYLAAGGEDIELAIPLAAGVELVHTATLVHDDINDHSPTRRGKLAVHARWGRTFALLTGDYLFTKVYELMAPYGPNFNIMMSDACVQLVEGETLQAAAAKEGTIDRETYKRIIDRKTASLFKTAAQMGATLAGGDEEIVNALGEYARNLGLAFQIVDDILDVAGDPDELGKPVGSDLSQGAGAILAQNGKKALAGTQADDVAEDPIKTMITQLRNSGAIEVAFAQAGEYARRARAELRWVPASFARDGLDTLVDLVLEREH